MRSFVVQVDVNESAKLGSRYCRLRRPGIFSQSKYDFDKHGFTPPPLLFCDLLQFPYDKLVWCFFANSMTPISYPPIMMCRIFTKSRFAEKLPGLFSMSRSASSSTSSSTDWNSHSEFFNFTGARWVSNEKYEMAMRHVPFDMNELAKLAAQSVGTTKCVHVEQMSQGLYNKPFLFSMEDGSLVIGKVPNLSAGLPHFTTASEVATMDFVRLLTCIWNSYTNHCFLLG